jgi:transcriptional regulator with XRE-family HTH domain
VPASPSSSAQEARRAVAVRLRELRLDAGLSGRAHAKAAGWHESKTSRIENAKTPPSDSDITTWCKVCSADDQAADRVVAAPLVGNPPHPAQ